MPRVDLPDAKPVASTSDSAGIDIDPWVKADEQVIREFMAQLKVASATDNKKALADMVQFPALIEVVQGKREPTLLNEDAFLTHYESIITPCIKQRIHNTELGHLHGGWKGFAIGNGQVWFSVYAEGPRITTINNHEEWCANHKERK